MSVVRDLRTLLKLDGFRKLLAVRLLSQLADGVFQVALATYVVFSPEKQTSAGAIASAMAVLLLPYSLVGPFAGVLLDRWSRRQVLFYGNLVRAVFAAVTAGLIAAAVPDWLFLLAALCVTAVNRFILAGLSASLPRVVDTDEQLVMGNSISPTAGTLAATSGAAVGFAVSLTGPEGTAADALTMLAAALVYVCAGLASLRIARNRLGPDPDVIQARILAAVASTARGLVEGLRHLASRPVAARTLLSMAVMRFCYGAQTVAVLMLCRYAWTDDNSEAMALLGLALGLSGAGFFVAAVVSPWAVARFGRLGWIALCSAAAAVVVVTLGLPFAIGSIMAAAFLLGVATQGAKIATDTVVQTTVSDDYRGRVFSLYDMLFNIAFVGAAAVAAVMLPPDGRSVPLVLAVAALYAAVAWVMFHVKRRAAAVQPTHVSRET